MQVWTSKEKADDKIIAFVNQTIYKGNPKTEDIESVLFQLKIKDNIPADLAGFPLSYIKEINLPEGKHYIELLFGRDSTEELKITDEQKKREIFDYFKTNIPSAIYSLNKPTALQSGKKPLIAFVVVAALFLWTLYVSVGIESGEAYDVTGQHYHSIAGIVLAIASIGVKKVILIFGSLLAIALVSFINKARNPTVTSKISLRQPDSSTFSL
ncbi:MAG: hypothetical protein ABI685_03160 [Ferruginibacter sp.]